jgi:hypothetical protein
MPHKRSVGPPRRRLTTLSTRPPPWPGRGSTSMLHKGSTEPAIPASDAGLSGNPSLFERESSFRGKDCREVTCCVARQFSSWNIGMYEMPTIAPSGDCSLATVCPHGSVRAGVQQREPRLLEFLRGRFHRRRVRNVELDTHLRHQPLRRPLRSPRAMRPERRAAVDVQPDRHVRAVLVVRAGDHGRLRCQDGHHRGQPRRSELRRQRQPGREAGAIYRLTVDPEAAPRRI